MKTLTEEIDADVLRQIDRRANRVAIAAVEELGGSIIDGQGRPPTVSSVSCLLLRELVGALTRIDPRATADMLHAVADGLTADGPELAAFSARQLAAQLTLAQAELAQDKLRDGHWGTA